MDNEKEAFGKLLVYLRQQRQMSQKELATELHVSSSCVCKWEKGNNLPDVTIYKSISDLFQLSCDELFHPEETLEKMSLGNDDSFQESVVDSPTIKKHVSISLLVGLTAFITLVLLLFFVFFRTRIFRQGYATDETWGQVYEIDYISFIEKDFESVDQHAENLRTKWVAGTLKPTQTDIIKISFYKGILNPSIDVEPYCTIYLFYYEAEGKEIK
ncbi:MAG: helix-turn-helix domain-containing protein [Acetatifactor sp.]